MFLCRKNTTKLGDQHIQVHCINPRRHSGPGSISGLGVLFGLSLLSVLVIAPRGFTPGSPIFSSPKKNPTNLPISIRSGKCPQLAYFAEYH